MLSKQLTIYTRIFYGQSGTFLDRESESQQLSMESINRYIKKGQNLTKVRQGFAKNTD